MKRPKHFDCVELKNQIQAEMNRDFAGLTEPEKRARLLHELSTSDDPVARKWRSLAERSHRGPTTEPETSSPKARG